MRPLAAVKRHAMTHPKLHVVTCISNPVRYSSRYRLYQHFAKHMSDSGAILHTVEMAFGQREHAITDPSNAHHTQLRSDHELWHKENMLNLVIQRLPHDWEYVAWIDADILFHRLDWVSETLEQLQHYQFLQLFSHATDLSPTFEPLGKHQCGFVYDYYHNPDKMKQGGYASFSHPGYAWAARREALDACGGLIDIGILGSGDRHMACAMIGKAEHSFNSGVHPNYKNAVMEWQRRCERHTKRNIGYVSGAISHFYHGSKSNRGYKDRWKILVEHQYDPYCDIRRDAQGLYQLDENKIGLRDDVRRYFRSRQEDCIFTGEYRLLP